MLEKNVGEVAVLGITEVIIFFFLVWLS